MGIMKKATILMMILALLLSLASCGGDKKAMGERAGYYKATSVVEDGKEADLKGFFEMGLGFFLVLNDDGTGYLDIMGEKSDFKWNKDELIVDNEGTEEKQPYSYDEGIINSKVAWCSNAGNLTCRSSDAKACASFSG